MEHIELEYRAEIPINSFDEVAKNFSKKFQTINHTKRLTYMGFIKSEEAKINVRIRITKDIDKNESETEIAVKKGANHQHDRTELETPILQTDFMKFVKMFNLILPEDKIVLERETINFKTENGLIISLVKATKHAYIEFEKLCNPEDKDHVSSDVLLQIEKLGFMVLDETASKDLFKRLDNEDDWKLAGTTDEMEKLEQKYILY